jgi:hypothetical protein
MATKKRPTPEDAVKAREILLSGLGRGAELPELAAELELLHPRNNTFPGEALLEVAASALEWCGASQANPIALEDFRERFLPEWSGRGRDRQKLQYAVLVAAALRGGAEPDLLDEIVWWQTDDFWYYALLATVAYIRAAADRVGVPVSQACAKLSELVN